MAKFIEADIVACMREMSNMKPGERIPYTTIERAVGYRRAAKKSTFQYVIDRSRERLKKDLRMVFKPVRNYGVYRLTDDEIVKSGLDGLNRINRSTERQMDTLKCVSDFEALSVASKISHNALMTTHKVVNRMTGMSALDSIERKISEMDGRMISFEEAVSFFCEC